ncbi:hypothetical protein [Saccharopolyspora sp. NPDC049426]|uniref:hypothetical protein n=1 Tax=Saccharopolyspora sp. NPDC049426 TaxID=3155652 RepID=UPI0034415112
MRDALVAELSSHSVDVRVQRHGRTGTIVVLIDERGERAIRPGRAAPLGLAVSFVLPAGPRQ